MPPLNGALIRERLHDGKTHAPERTNQASYEFHPVAEMFPLLQGKDFDALVEDIRHYGLIYPIIVYEDQILEGRNRYRACLAAKVERRFEQFTGDDPKRDLGQYSSPSFDCKRARKAANRTHCEQPGKERPADWARDRCRWQNDSQSPAQGRGRAEHSARRKADR